MSSRKPGLASMLNRLTGGSSGELLDRRTIVAVRYIYDHYDTNVTIDDVAGHVKCSRSTLQRLFRTDLGSTIWKVVLEMRIEHAKRLLRRNRSRSITEVALASGFADHSWFCHVFRNRTGMSPGEFQQTDGSNS